MLARFGRLSTALLMLADFPAPVVGTESLAVVAETESRPIRMPTILNRESESESMMKDSANSHTRSHSHSKVAPINRHVLLSVEPSGDVDMVSSL